MNLNKISTTILSNLSKIYKKENYCIDGGYKHRKNYTYLDKTESTEEWQKEVYEFAQNFMNKNEFKSIIDFGCGSGYKMIKYFDKFESTGAEVSETYEFLKNKYPQHNWLNVDTLDPESFEADVVICADVIEHVLNPDEFLNSLNKIKYKYLIISTPDRFTLHGYFNYGPPKNPFHIREWTCREFNKYLASFYNIHLHQITNLRQGTQMVLCSKK